MKNEQYDKSIRRAKLHLLDAMNSAENALEDLALANKINDIIEQIEKLKK